MLRFEPFKLERFFAKHEFSARWLLCSSDCETTTVDELLALAPGSVDRLLGLRLGYTESRGSPALRDAIAARYASVSADAVLTFSGAEEAILDFFAAVLDTGDRVVVNSPRYQSLGEIPRALGCELVDWPVREEGGRWEFDPDELSTIARGAKMIVLNAPHNPTGALPTREEHEAIIDVARREGAILFSDEVYRELEHDPDRRLASAADVYENAVSLGVLSKAPGLAGLRVGWVATRRSDLLDAAARFKDYDSICSSGPSEIIAEVAVRHLDSLIERNRRIVAANLALLDGFFGRRQDFASWTRPEGGSVGFPKLTGGRDAEAFADRLVAEAGVLVMPGSYCDYDRSYFRIGYGRANMGEALEELERYIDAHAP